MKKLLSVLVALVIVVGIGSTSIFSASAATPSYRGGHHMGGTRSRMTAEERDALHEEYREEYEAYLDELVKNGTLTKKEADAYKADPDRLSNYCGEFGSEEHRNGMHHNNTYNNNQSGRGGCHGRR